MTQNIAPYELFAYQVESEPDRFPKKIRLMVERYRHDLTRDDIYFDHDEAIKHINFVKLVPLIDLKEFAKKPVPLQGWQAFFIANIYGWKWKVDRRRKYTKVYLQIARKNSKTTLSSILAIDNAINDPDPGAQIYFAATNRDQAELCFRMAQRMCGEMSLMYKSFASRCKVWRGSVEFLHTQTIMKPVTGDPSSLEGMGAKLAIIDELHVHKNDELINSISKGQVLHSNPLLIMITTAGYDKRPEAPAYQNYLYSSKVLQGIISDDSYFCMVWELDEDDDWNDQNLWYKANPNLGLSPKLEALRTEYTQAKNLGGAKEVDFKIKHLNMFVDSDAVWISQDVLKQNQKPLDQWPEEVQMLYNGIRVSDTVKARAGLDLASVYDFTSLCIEVEYEDHIYVWWKFYLPEQTVKNHPDENYRHWARSGFITVTPGNATDYSFIKKDITQLFEAGVISNVYYDRFNSSQLVIDLSEQGVPMVKMGQGFLDMNGPTKDIEKLILQSRVQHNSNPVLLWMMGNVKILYNENQDQKISKKNSNGKVDGPVAWCMARKANMDKLNTYTDQPKIWLI